MAELSHHPNIIAIKESSGNLEKVMQMIREVKKGFQVLTGSAPTLAPSLAVGASGAVLAFANAAPYATISIWEAHRTREPEAALDWQNRIGRAAYLVTTKYGVPGLKYAMDLTGYYGGPPRLPLTCPLPRPSKRSKKLSQTCAVRYATSLLTRDNGAMWTTDPAPDSRHPSSSAQPTVGGEVSGRHGPRRPARLRLPDG